MPDQNKKTGFSEKNLTDEQKAQYRELKKTAQSFTGKSEADLLKELNNKISEGKQKGTITAKQLERFEKKVGPMLDEQQKKKLKKIMETLNNK